MFVGFVELWIWVSALASLAGWTLSALGMLNRTGYAIFLAAVIAAVFLFRKASWFSSLFSVGEFKKLRPRFRRFLPASFAFLAGLIFISGLLYAPDNHTGLSYRLPRVLQWLQHGRWFWIHTPNYRMNDRACGIEWLSAPMLLFLRSDRALFLLNFIPFVLMPGLIFSVWTRLGVRPRVAWSWMWLVPTGYCFLIQAGGIANDAFPTVYALATMDFALRARAKLKVESGASRVEERRRSGAASDLGLSLLAAALMVGAKASNLPLGLPWVIIFFPALWSLWAQYFPRRGQPVSRFAFHLSASAGLFVIAVAISFVPTAILNIHYVHDWSGLNIEHAGMDMKNPIAGVVGNTVLLLIGNFTPTLFPMAGWWNHHALSYFPHALVRLMDANFEAGYIILGELPIEDSAGLGFGISVLIVVSLLGALKYRGRSRTVPVGAPRLSIFHSRLLLVAPWFSLLAYCMKTGMVTPFRLVAPYYPLLLPALLIGASQSRIVRRPWWRVSAAGVLALALIALVLNPSRPLWPAKTILSRAVARHPNQRQLVRAETVYQVYADRPDPLAGIRQWFPPGLKVIGFMGTGDDLDISLWKPYGSRRVEPFFVEDSPEEIRKMGIEYAVVGSLNLEFRNVTLDDWLQRSGAEIIASTNATMTVIQGPTAWYLVRFKR
jgi:hypothetical protein